MVKGISRRVVVIDSPDQRFFEQAIFIVRNDAAGEGITSRELVEEARRVARNYASGDHGRFSRVWRNLSPAVYTLMGAAAIGLIWLIVALIEAPGYGKGLPSDGFIRREALESIPGLYFSENSQSVVNHKPILIPCLQQ